MVDRDVAIAALVGLASYLSKQVPDARTLAIRVPSPLDLISCRGGSPQKVLRKRSEIFVNHRRAVYDFMRAVNPRVYPLFDERQPSRSFCTHRSGASPFIFWYRLSPKG
jgi:hypothetical protein